LKNYARHTYSFKEIVINDSLCDNYDIDSATAFVKALLYDLPKAYAVSDYGQKRVLLGSIFPSGVTYKDGKLLNPEVSPIFRAIDEVVSPSVNFSAGKRTRTSTSYDTRSLGVPGYQLQHPRV
jgi:hypothetical protein